MYKNKTLLKAVFLVNFIAASDAYAFAVAQRDPLFINLVATNDGMLDEHRESCVGFLRLIDKVQRENRTDICRLIVGVNSRIFLDSKFEKTLVILGDNGRLSEEQSRLFMTGDLLLQFKYDNCEFRNIEVEMADGDVVIKSEKPTMRPFVEPFFADSDDDTASDDARDSYGDIDSYGATQSDNDTDSDIESVG